MDFFSPSQLLRRIFLAVSLSLCAVLICLSIPSPLLASPVSGEPTAYVSIRQDLIAGRANQAISQLHQQLAVHSTDAAAHNLLCRVYLQEERWPDAERECEQAVQLEPQKSSYHLWLGRAYGGAAAHSPIRSAYFLARKVHAEFETAVRLDPHNVSALSDLGEYQIDVPRLMGGGVDQAEHTARQLAPLNPARYHALLAKIAEKKSDFSTAEQEWKLAIQSSSHPADPWMGLAALYARQKNFTAMRQAIASGAATPDPGDALVVGATLLTDNHQNSRQAIQLLQRYLASPRQSEDSPAFQVRVQLGKLLASQGDQAAAQRQYAMARAMASKYVPAWQAVSG